MNATTLIIKYPNGATQVVKPKPEFFKGDWASLAQAIAGEYFPRGHKDIPRVTYEIR